MKNYYATLKLGRVYKLKNRLYERGQEVAVTEEEVAYLKTLGEKQLSTEGNKMVAVFIPRFNIREEEMPMEQKVLAEIENASDNLTPRKPGPKPKEASNN